MIPPILAFRMSSNLFDAPHHAPLMHLTSCYISFPLRYSIAPANEKILWEDRIPPGVRHGGVFRVFLFSTVLVSRVSFARDNNTALAVSFLFYYKGTRSCSPEHFLFKRAISLAKNDSTLFPPAANHTRRTVFAFCIMRACFLALYICISPINMLPLQNERFHTSHAARHEISSFHQFALAF